MKNLFLTLTIGLTAMACSRLEKESLNKENGDIYEGIILNAGFGCDYIIDFKKVNGEKINTEKVEQLIIVKPTNLPEKYKHDGTIVSVQFSSLKKIDFVHCGGFYGYGYEGTIKNIR